MAIVDNPNNYAGAGTKTPTDKIIQASIGGLATTAAVAASAATAAQNQLNAGVSTPSIEASVAAQVDGAINADAGNYMNNRTPDRAAAADVAKSRTPRISGVYTANIPQVKIKDAKNNNDTNMLFLLSDMEKDGKMPYMQIAFADYTRPNPFAPAKLNPKQTIYMPIPQELLDPTSIEWSLTTLNTVGNITNMATSGLKDQAALDAAGATTAAAGMSLLGAGINAMGQTLNNRSFGAATQIVGSVTSSAAPNIVTLIEQGLGAVPNPNPSYAFRGPSLRTYSFSWVIHPRNEQESINMMNVINALKKHALPGTKIGTNTALLDYPSMCQINLMPWDRGGTGPYGWTDNTFIKYKKSVITGISVNFAPNGVPAFFRGNRKAPVFASLMVSFAEIEFFIDQDFGEAPGGSTTDFLANAAIMAANTFSSLVSTAGEAAGQIISNSIGLITDPPPEEPPAEPPAE